MNKLYEYDKDTRLFVREVYAQLNDVATERTGKEVYFVIPYTTETEPPSGVPQGYAAAYNLEEDNWNQIEDHRGQMVYNVELNEIVPYNQLGPIVGPYVAEYPDTDVLKYMRYDGTKFVLNREQILELIWEMRKTIRDSTCASDLEYNGHMYHVDAVSLNDIMLAAQEAILSQDFTTTKRWVTADDINVLLTGTDFVAIMRLYGDRRQQLVYESNDAWQSDITKTDDELIAVYRELNGGVAHE